jgi:HD superfamily phosphohydrolase
VWQQFIGASVNAYQRRKIIHDPIWGTARYEPWEAALLDLPLFQRLRGLKQTGFAYLTYPAAEHSRFQHTLGVTHAASKIFDSIVVRRQEDGVSRRAKAAGLHASPILTTDSARFRILLRLATLVHDLGHSFYSHTSERIFGLVPPFPDLVAELQPEGEKPPGPAEVVVYLLVTSEPWQKRVGEIWKVSAPQDSPPSSTEWETIGRWVMGQERDPLRRFLADIVSGPLDADKLDYISRDAYFAGIPVGYDLERFTATVCVDEQAGRARLTLPVKGINALEQLIMGRLVLNSYLYHHQKVRAAEAQFERLIFRELVRTKRVLGVTPPWSLFEMQDADVYCRTRTEGNPYRLLLERNLPVTVTELKAGAIANVNSEAVSSEFSALLAHSAVTKYETYKKLVDLEDELAAFAGCSPGSVIIDVPKPPKYPELEDLQLPDDQTGEAVDPRQILAYPQWIAAYNAYRPFVRVFAERGVATPAVCNKVLQWFATKNLQLPEHAARHH